MPRRVRDTYHKIGELLVRRKLAPAEAVDEALALQRSALQHHRTAPKLGEILVERKVLNRKLVREILEEQQIGRGQKRVLRVDLRDSGGIAVVVLDGRFDGARESRVTRILERLMNRGFSRLAMDCTKLIYLDSHAISCLVSYIDEARARGGDMKFFGMTPDAQVVLKRLGLLKFVQHFPREPEAVKAFELPIDEYMSRGALAEYVSASGSRYFHLSYCSAAQSIREDDRLYFESKWHARDAGKLPCKRCRP